MGSDQSLNKKTVVSFIYANYAAVGVSSNAQLFDNSSSLFYVIHNVDTFVFKHAN